MKVKLKLKRRKITLKFPNVFSIKKHQVVLSGLGILVALILDILLINNWITENRKIELNIQDIEISYLAKDDPIYNRIYPLFNDYVNDEKEYYLGNDCATKLIVTNHHTSGIVISEIVLDVKNIEIDYTPHLAFTNCLSTESGQLNIAITNSGWSDVSNVKIKAIGINEELTFYFREEALEITVPCISVGETVTIPFLKNTDLLRQCNDSITFFIDFVVECESPIPPTVSSDYVFYLENNNLAYYPTGGGEDTVYGIKIDTEQSQFLWSEDISEIIPSKDTMVFPVCFFPDKSCSMEFRFSMTIVHDGAEYVITSPLRKADFFISSVQSIYYALSDYDKEKEIITSVELASYPVTEAMLLDHHMVYLINQNSSIPEEGNLDK